MSETLSQAEIEALLASLATGGALDSEPASSPSPDKLLKTPAKRKEVEQVYDFRRPDKFSRDQIRTLQMVHETFARLSATNLSAYLRTPVYFEVISLDQVTFEEYIRSLAYSTFTIFSMHPLAGQSVLEIEFPLVFSLLDRLLGGPGHSITRTGLTEIERPLVITLAERILMALRGAWESILTLEPRVEELETSAQFVQVAPPNDIVITVILEARVGEQRGAMSLCIPYMVIKPITPKLSSQRWIASSGKQSSPRLRQLISTQLNHVTLPCIVRLGNARLRLQQLLSLKVGETIVLNTPVHGKAEVLIGGRLRFRGRPAVRNRKLVLAITEVVSEV